MGLSADGKWMVSGCTGGDVLIWEISTGRLQPKIDLDKRDRERLDDVVLVGDGKWLVTSAGGHTRLWEVKTGKHLRLINGFFGGVSADGKSLLTFNGTSQKDIRENFLTRVWDVATGDEKQTVFTSFPSEERPWSRVWTAILSPDGKQMIVVIDEHSADSQYTIRLWEVATGIQTRVFEGHNRPISKLLMSPDGKLLYSRTETWERPGFAEAIIWEVATGKKLIVWKSK